MGKYIKKSKIAGDVSLKDISSHPTTLGLRTRVAAKNLAVQRLRSHSTSPSVVDADSFRYLQLRSRRLVKLPDTRKHHQKQLAHGVDRCRTRNPRAKPEKPEPDTTVMVTESEDREATESVPSSSEIEDFFAYAEDQQQRLFIEKYNFDFVSENPLPGNYEWVKVMP